MRPRHHATLFTAAAVLGLSPSLVAGQARRYVEPVMAGDTASLPFSDAVLVGNTLYVGGTVGRLRQQVPETAAEEARALMEYLQETLADADMTMDDLVMVQVFCSDLSAYADFNRVYRTFFTREVPPRAFVGVELLGGRFEVTAIAVKR